MRLGRKKNKKQVDRASNTDKNNSKVNPDKELDISEIPTYGVEIPKDPSALDTTTVNAPDLKKPDSDTSDSNKPDAEQEDARYRIVNDKDIININKLSGPKFPNEVYAIELLANDIYMEKNHDNKITITIDREVVQAAVITDKGKSELNKLITEQNIEGFMNLVKKDQEIQGFLNGTLDNRAERLKLKDLGIYLRWASGGVLSIVEYNDRKYIPLFYRDKKPFGWNLFIGSTERQFDANGNLINNVFDEFNNPLLFINREFEEELLVFDEYPDSNKKNNKIVPICLTSHSAGIEKYYNKHIALRNKYDRLNIIEHENKFIQTKVLNTDMIVKIGNRNFSDFLICFNLMELGIEVVQVVMYRLEKGNVLIDGEILTNEEDELVRMPIALISCDFLKKHFKGNLNHLGITEGANSSFYINEPIPEEEMVLFNYDLIRRRDIVNGNTNHMKVRPGEIERYQTSFMKYFNITDCTVLPEASKYFTPASAKMLNLMFQQVNPAEYE